jgi:phosphatidylglycerol:prolipoprotein diacylglycerol transferase
MSIGVTFPATSPPYQHQLQTGLFAGVRIDQRSIEDTPTIGYIDPQGPAAAAGMLAGTVIQKINGKPASEWPSALAQVMAGGDLELEATDGKTYRWAVPPLATRSKAVHPVQLYAAVDAALLCLLLWAYYPFRRRDGEVFAMLLLLHAVARFLQESIRDDQGGIVGTSLTIAQWLSVAMFLAGLGLLAYISRRPRGTAWPPAHAATSTLPTI